MIFASDLDRTLVYSKRAINELGWEGQPVLRPVEKKDQDWVAFMTESSYLALKDLSGSALFIPVTTRTTEQFNRFGIFHHEIPLKYAVTTNGAVILFEGKPMEEWTNYISRCLQDESCSQDELLSILKNEGFRIDGKLKAADHLFFYFILNSLPSSMEVSAIQRVALKNGWRISLQGRKLYIIPQVISKGTALDFICKREGMKAIAGAGDSNLDWDFLKLCQYRFVPSHGELLSLPHTTGLTFTKEYGVRAGEEILHQFLGLLHSEDLTFLRSPVENKVIQAGK